MSKIYTTIQGDMWDSIAKRCYGDEAGMNVLMAANPEYISTVVFSAGVTLIVPDYTKPAVSALPPWRRT